MAAAPPPQYDLNIEVENIKKNFKKSKGVEFADICMLCYGTHPGSEWYNIYNKPEVRGFVIVKELQMLYGPIDICYRCSREYGGKYGDDKCIITPPQRLGLSWLPTSTNMYKIPSDLKIPDYHPPRF